MKSNLQKNNRGFSLIETLLYLLIMGLLLLVIASVAVNVFNTRRQFKAADLVQSNGRFIVNLLNNRIHNIDLIDDVSPAPETFHFYEFPDKRLSLKLDNENLVFQEAIDAGSGFPEQASVEPVILNNDSVRVSDLVLTAISDNDGNSNQGVIVNFVLTVGYPEDYFGYYQETFNTFFSLR